jgi:hypothetical protein
MVDLDELREKWAELDRKFDMNIRLNRQLLSATKLNQTQSAMRRLSVYMGVELVAWFAIIVALGNFVYEQISVARFGLPAVALDVYSIGMAIALTRQIAAARQIDYSQPIATIQRKVEALRVLRIRSTQWAVLAGVAVWAPFLIVVSKAAFGADVYQVFGPAWLWSNVLFGLALIPLTLWVSKTFGDRMVSSPWLRRIMRDLAGRNLNAAAGFLAILKQFEEESSVG